MVRLLRGYAAIRRSSSPLFQSHNGAIAAQLRELVGRGGTDSFNPTMVRLLPLVFLCCVRGTYGFNPTMVRLLPRQNFGVWGQNEAK